jgi:hypothetical protein
VPVLAGHPRQYQRRAAHPVTGPFLSLVNITSEGLSYAREDVSGLPAVIEFDPGSLVLTAFGRVNAGTIRGDRAVADRFLNSFFRI